MRMVQISAALIGAALAGIVGAAGCSVLAVMFAVAVCIRLARALLGESHILCALNPWRNLGPQ